ncbi:CHAP domain-containing protein [Nocardia sp. NPDC049149]|uniref:CHAP domain-containing protein n=1 Tax=Nocardia sp. NPDC049149 TaxID=3364315 RepID=UPI00371C1E81
MADRKSSTSHGVRYHRAGTSHGEPQQRRRVGPWLGVGVLVLVLALAGVFGVRWWQERSAPAIAGERATEFPALDRSAFDPTQTAVVTVAEREFRAQGAGEKYAEGVSEPWCADFVSWVMREAGAPLANPNSGSWRIPGVYTLQEYYASTGRFVRFGGYQPRTGDVLLYDDTSPFNQHTNIVLRADGGRVTTIGGNEFGQITLHTFALAEVPGIVGFGRL